VSTLAQTATVCAKGIKINGKHADFSVLLCNFAAEKKKGVQ
jgi:hypothetical protein